MSSLIARLRTSFENLSPRERMLVLGAGGLVLFALVSFGIVSPIFSASARSTLRVSVAESQLAAAVRLRGELDEVNTRLGAVEERIRSGPKGEIFTTLETLASDSAVKVDSMEPRTAPANDDFKETKVQVVLKGVSLAQVVNYMHRIEASAQVLSIKSLRIRTRKDKPEMLDATFTVSSFEPV